jgi:hypothetical protein
MDRMVNTCKLPINVVNDNKPKMLTGLAKRQAAWFWGSIFPSHDADTAPPAKRQDLNGLRKRSAGSSSAPRGRNAQRGKPAREERGARASHSVDRPPPQAAHMPKGMGKEAVRPNEGRRVSEDGKSECRPAIGRIGACADQGTHPFLRQHGPTRKRADFRKVFRHEKGVQPCRKA